MIKQKLVYTLWILLLLVSCDSKNEKENIEYVPLPEIMQQYVYLEGSYWIYENDSTGILDTAAVISVENDYCVSTPIIHGQSGTSLEYYKLTYFSSVFQSTFVDFICNTIIGRNGGTEYCKPGQPVFVPDQNTGYDYNGLSIIQQYQFFSVNGVSFNNVTEVKITKANQLQDEFDYDTNLFFADSIGIIKKQIYMDNGFVESWSLIDKHIVR